MFERLHGRGDYPGTGIGLALCRKIAERHGGTVVADSVPGVGSTFTVTLPDAAHGSGSAAAPTGDDDSEPAPGGAPCSRLSRATRPFTILLADDDEEDRELARDALQDSRLANEMRFVVDGQDLMDYLRREGRWADRRSTLRARGSSCWTSTCPRRTAARRWPRSRPTSPCGGSRSSC